MKEIKLGNIFEGNIIGFTQSPHGTPNGLAIDCRHPDKANKNIIAPTDGIVEAVLDSGQQRYFHLSCRKWKLRFVHCKPTIKAGTKVKRGQKIGELVPYYDKNRDRADHCHAVVLLAEGPRCVMIYFDRSLGIQLIGNFKSKQWGNWDYWNKNWGDRKLASCEVEPKPTPPPVNPCIQYKDQIVELEKLNRDKDATIKKQGLDIQAKKTEITILNNQVADYKKQLGTVSNLNNFLYKMTSWLRKKKA